MSGASTGKKERALIFFLYMQGQQVFTWSFCFFGVPTTHAKLSVSTLLLHHCKNSEVILTQ